MADYLQRARLVAEITELRKQQSEAHIRDIYNIYASSTADERVVRQRRDARIASLRLELAALDDGEPGLIRGAPWGKGGM